MNAKRQPPDQERFEARSRCPQCDNFAHVASPGNYFCESCGSVAVIGHVDHARPGAERGMWLIGVARGGHVYGTEQTSPGENDNGN